MYIDEPFWTVDTLFFTEIKEVIPKFVYYLFLNINWLKYNEASGVPSLSANNIYKININIPSKKEQEKIADFLSLINEKIELLEKKLSLYQSIKKYLLNKIMTCQLRFNEFICEWKILKIKDIISSDSSNLSMNNLENNFGEYPLYGADGFIKNVDFYQKNDKYVAIVKDGAGVGRLKLLPKNSSVLSTLNYLMPNNNVNTYFVYYLLKTLNFNKYIVGSTIPHIYFKDYSNEKIKIPTLKEQKKIAEFLLMIDKKIDLLEKKLSLYQSFKKSLLQQMFI